jgi:hypothetical protein
MGSGTIFDAVMFGDAKRRQDRRYMQKTASKPDREREK